MRGMHQHKNSLVLLFTTLLISTATAFSKSNWHISISTPKTEAVINSTISLRCSCANAGQGSSESLLDTSSNYSAVSLVWLKNDVLLSEIGDPLTSIGLLNHLDNGTVESEMTISRSREHHSGTYTCVCSPKDSGEMDASVLAFSQVTIAQKPSVVLSRRILTTLWTSLPNNGEIEMEEESSLILNCQVTTTGSATLQWFRDGVPLPESSDSVGVRELVMAINGIVESDAGRYTCEAQNSAGYGNSSVQLLVTRREEVIDILNFFHLQKSVVGDNFAVVEYSPQLNASVSVCFVRDDGTKRVSRIDASDTKHVLLSDLDEDTNYKAWVGGVSCAFSRSAELQWKTLTPLQPPLKTSRPTLGAAAETEHMADEDLMAAAEVLMEDSGQHITVNWSTALANRSCLLNEVFVTILADAEHPVLHRKYLRSGIHRNLRLSASGAWCVTVTILCHLKAAGGSNAMLRTTPAHFCMTERPQNSAQKRLVRRAVTDTTINTEADTEIEIESGADGPMDFEIDNSTDSSNSSIIDEILVAPEVQRNRPSAREPTKPSWDRVDVNTSSVFLSWIHRPNASVNADYWEIRYGKTDPNEHNITVRQTNCTIGELQQGTTYVFVVSACNMYGCGQPIYESVAVERDGDEANELQPPLQVMAVSLDSTAIVVSWVDQNARRYRDSRYYTVKITEIVPRVPATAAPDSPSRTSEQMIEFVPFESRSRDKQRYINASNTQLTIDTLQPFTEYEFEVRVNKGSRKSPWSMKAHNRTLETAPTQAPVELKARLIGDGRVVELRWRPVPPRHQNGVIRSYQVAYSTNINYPDSKWIVENVNGSALSCTIRHLQPGTGYYFKIRAKTLPRNFGPFSNTVFIETDLALRPMPTQSASTPPTTAAETTKSNLNDEADRQAEDGKVHGIAVETWYIIIGCGAGISAVVFIVMAVSIVKKRRRRAEIQRRKAEYVNRRFTGQLPNSAASPQAAVGSCSNKSNFMNKSRVPMYPAASSPPATTPIQNGSLKQQSADVVARQRDVPAAQDYANAPPTVRFNVRYEAQQQMTPLGSPTYSAISSTDGPHSHSLTQSLTETATSVGYQRASATLAKLSTYEQLTSGYCPSIDTCSSATSMTNPRPAISSWALPTQGSRENAMATPKNLRLTRKGSSGHRCRHEQQMNCAATEIGAAPYCGHNRYGLPGDTPTKRSAECEAYNAPTRFALRKDEHYVYHDHLGCRPDAETYRDATSTQIVHPVQPYRVVESVRKGADSVKRIDPDPSKNPVGILKIAGNTDNTPPQNQARRISTGSGDKNNLQSPLSGNIGFEMSDYSTVPPLLANLTIEQAKNADKTVKFIPLVKVNINDGLGKPSESDLAKLDSHAVEMNLNGCARSASQQSSQSQSSSSNSTGATQVSAAQSRHESLNAADVSQNAAIAPPSATATATSQRACCAKTCTYCCADSTNQNIPPLHLKNPTGQQCNQVRVSDKLASEMRKIGIGERPFSHFYTERV